MRWFELISFQAKLSPDEPAVMFPGGMATYGRLVECVENASQHVLRAGLKKGDVVALELRHPLLHLVLILALHRCGIASITLQTSYLIEQSRLKIDRLLSDRYQPSDSSLSLILVSNDWLTASSAPALPLTGFANPDDVCRLVLSSGTTGMPKVIAVSERTLENRFRRAALTNERGRCLCMMGFSTLGGYQTLMTALALGGSVCFAGAPEDVLQVISLFHVTHLIAAPFQIRSLLDAQAKNGLQCPSLRQVFLAGGVLPSSLIAEVRRQLCPNVICAYGSTEMGLVAYGPAARMRDIDGATGFVIPGEVIEIVDQDGNLLGADQDGMVRIKCDHIDEYFLPTEEDSKIFKDGYFYPGDLGRLLSDRILVITGRADEVINRGGDKAAPELIEEVIRKIPQIVDTAVFAVPGTKQIWAAVVCKGELQDRVVLEACRQRLAGMAPDRLFKVDRIPRNDMGKIIREDMKKIIMRLLSWSFMS
ncbi:MAG TPA: fatty acid--CoA ligase family protein [Xanthobacteraceae bacterium]|nr:fatty acid--CoA ligase family protein [Xanthobacteraceae bacterium]